MKLYMQIRDIAHLKLEL